MFALVAVIVLVVILVYYFLVFKKNHIARVRLYKPKELFMNHLDDNTTYQIAQVVLFNSDGVALNAPELEVSSGEACWGTNNKTPFDGNTNDQKFPHVYHSCPADANNFLQAKLLKPQELSMVKVYNRSDCCANRLTGVVVELYNDSDELLESYTLTNKSINVIDLKLKTVA